MTNEYRSTTQSTYVEGVTKEEIEIAVNEYLASEGGWWLEGPLTMEWDYSHKKYAYRQALYRYTD